MKLRGLIISMCVGGLLWVASDNAAVGADWLSSLFGARTSGSYSVSSGGYKYWSNPSSTGWSITFPNGGKVWGSNYGSGWSFPTPSGKVWGSTYSNGTQLWGSSWDW